MVDDQIFRGQLEIQSRHGLLLQGVLSRTREMEDVGLGMHREHQEKIEKRILRSIVPVSPWKGT
jgi:hypothetical protein